MIKIRLGIY